MDKFINYIKEYYHNIDIYIYMVITKDDFIVVKKYMPRGRPRVLTDEQRRANKTAYMGQTEWYCSICNNGINYRLTGKTYHLRSKKHKKNASQ